MREARLVLLPPQLSALQQLTSLNVSDCHLRSLPSEVRGRMGWRGYLLKPLLPCCSPSWGGFHSYNHITPRDYLPLSQPPAAVISPLAHNLPRHSVPLLPLAPSD